MRKRDSIVCKLRPCLPKFRNAQQTPRSSRMSTIVTDSDCSVAAGIFANGTYFAHMQRSYCRYCIHIAYKSKRLKYNG
jgi:hypothetical protein